MTDATDKFKIVKQYAVDHFSKQRYMDVMVLFKHFGKRLLEAPASSNVYFHNSFPGGYLDHIVNVIEASFKITNVTVEMGGEIDFTEEEMVFCAMFHDLGKLGTLDKPNYIKLNEIGRTGRAYKYNSDIPYASYTDRSIWLLQHFGIGMTEKEMKAIRMADGLFEPANEEYFKRSSPFPGHLSYVIHWADHLATNCEKDMTLRALGEKKADER